MNKNVIIIPLILLAACAQQRAPEVIEGNAEGVVVSWARADSVKGALGVADNYCKQYGKKARYVGKVTDFQLSYDCVKATR